MYPSHQCIERGNSDVYFDCEIVALVSRRLTIYIPHQAVYTTMSCRGVAGSDAGIV